MNNTGWIIAGLVLVAVVIGGVVWSSSSSDDESTADSSTNTSQTEATQQEQQNIVELAQATPELSTLVTAVVAADLAETLSGPGPFTVFAPTNDAFAALPDGTLDDLLLPENKDQLTEVLTYHVVSGDVMSSDLSDGQKVETIQGQELTVKIQNGVVTINGAEVVIPDVDASNGVVHVIDQVLLPS